MRTMSLRRGISLTEILIGILVLGIGVISLATLFPLGLLQLRRAVNDVRGTIAGRNAWNEARFRNLVEQPLGPPAAFFTRYPVAGDVNPAPNPDPNDYWQLGSRPIESEGLPVIIDPLWMLQQDPDPANPTFYFNAFGRIDQNGDGLADFVGAEGILRVRGGTLNQAGYPSGGAAVGTYPIQLAFQIFASPDDLTYGEGTNSVVPFQSFGAGTVTPGNGVPFTPGTLFREPRYTWMALVRKVNASQSPVYRAGGPTGNGTFGDPANPGYAELDDILENRGGNPDITLPGRADDPARDMVTGLPVEAPIGPFQITLIVFYNRDFTQPETVYANDILDFDRITLANTNLDPARAFVAGSDVATLYQRSDGIQFPDVPVGSYVMDTTFQTYDAANPLAATAPPPARNGFVYQVIGKTKSLVPGPNNTQVMTLSLTLDKPARADGTVLTVLRRAVGVFEEQIP